MEDVIEMETAAAPPVQTRQLAQVAPSDLLRYALDSGADLDRLEKLMELQERHEAKLARMAFVEAMAEFKKKAPIIYKDKEVSFPGTHYNHATLGGVCEAVISLLAENGISHDWDTEQPDNGMIVVKCTLTHKLGHEKSTSLQAPPDNSGKKNGIQQISSAITYLQRYSLLGACGLATNDIVDDDGRGAGTPGAAPEEKPVVKKEITGKAFDRALASVRAGQYKVAEIKKFYILTADQDIALADLEKEMK